MTSAPRVSCIVPCYNYGRFLARAIDSVLAQTAKDLECIVVDDGSTDETPQVMATYADRVRCIRKVNGGISSTRNAGIAAARGEYLAFLDADDWWEPQKIARQVELMDENPRVGASGVGEQWLDAQLRPTIYVGAFHPLPTWQENVRAIAVRKIWIGAACSGMIIRRAVLDDIGGFDESLRCAEDWDFFLRLVARYPIADLDEHLNNRVLHQTGVFRNAALYKTQQTRVYELACERWPEVLDRATRHQMRALILADAGGELAQAGKRRSAISHYAASLLWWPFDLKRWRSVAALSANELLRRSPTS